jgi:hypothetical protein
LCVGGCGSVVSGRRKRCPECRRKLQRRLDKRRYHESKGQDIRDYEHAADSDGEIIDYSHGGDALPGLHPITAYRNNPRHDAVTRARLDAQAQDQAAEADITDWESLQEMRARYGQSTVAFPPAPTTSGDVFGRRSSRYQGQPIDNPAAAGELYRASPVAGQRALYDHISRR